MRDFRRNFNFLVPGSSIRSHFGVRESVREFSLCVREFFEAKPRMNYVIKPVLGVNAIEKKMNHQGIANIQII